mgnify:CR=1
MKISYASKKLEGICTDEKKCKKFRSDIVRGVKLRHNALETADSMEDLKDLDPGGRWHQLCGDREGQWAGKLNKNYRIIVEPSDGGLKITKVEQAGRETSVTVLSIVDYH